MMRITGWSLLLCVLLASPVWAQDPDSVQLQNDCRLAAQILTGGHPAPQEEWALTVIHRCGPDGGAALASALRNARASTDTDYLSQLSARARWLRDGAFFNAALEVAGDKAATGQARLESFVVLLYAVRLAGDPLRGVPIYSQELSSPLNPASGLPTGSCSTNRFSTGAVKPTEGAPLPANYHDQISALGRRIFRDVSEPLELRTAAFCLY